MSDIVSAAALEKDPKPVLSLNFDGTDKLQTLPPVVKDGMNAIRTGTLNRVALPNCDAYNTGDELTVEFWVKLASVNDMPVIVCHGSSRSGRVLCAVPR